MQTDSSGRWMPPTAVSATGVLQCWNYSPHSTEHGIRRGSHGLSPNYVCQADRRKREGVQRTGVALEGYAHQGAPLVKHRAPTVTAVDSGVDLHPQQLRAAMHVRRHLHQHALIATGVVCFLNISPNDYTQQTHRFLVTYLTACRCAVLGGKNMRLPLACVSRCVHVAHVC